MGRWVSAGEAPSVCHTLTSEGRETVDLEGQGQRARVKVGFQERRRRVWFLHLRRHLSSDGEQATDIVPVRESPNPDSPLKEANVRDHMYRYSIYVKCPGKATLYKGKPALRVGAGISHKWEQGAF